MKKTHYFYFFCLSLFFSGGAFSQETSEEILAVTFDGKNVYHQKLENNTFKPYVDVLCTPEGRNILRDSPWDHIHHHALMYAVSVNGVDFWGEFDETRGKQIVTSTFVKTRSAMEESGKKEAHFQERSTLDWTIPEGTVVLKETRSVDVRCSNNSDVTLLTWNSHLAATDSLPTVTLGGDHYYGLGMRFNETMDQDGRFFTNAGTELGEIVRGDERLTSCRWMAYTAKLDGKPVTVALFDAPQNPRPMLTFTMGDSGKPFAYLSATLNLFREAMELTEKNPLDFTYGVAVWEGEKTQEEVQTVYQNWLQQK